MLVLLAAAWAVAVHAIRHLPFPDLEQKHQPKLQPASYPASQQDDDATNTPLAASALAAPPAPPQPAVKSSKAAPAQPAAQSTLSLAEQLLHMHELETQLTNQMHQQQQLQKQQQEQDMPPGFASQLSSQVVEAKFAEYSQEKEPIQGKQDQASKTAPEVALEANSGKTGKVETLVEVGAKQGVSGNNNINTDSGDGCLNYPFQRDFSTSDSVLVPGIPGDKTMRVLYTAVPCGVKRKQLQWSHIITLPRDPDTTWVNVEKGTTEFLRLPTVLKEAANYYGTPRDPQTLSDGKNATWKAKYLGDCGVAPTDFSQAGVPIMCPPGKTYPEQLYEKLYSLFGNKDQLLTFEWPGRLLDEKTYMFDYQDSYSNFLKPVTVQEAEYRLADDLFPLAQITGGPSGYSLTTMYKLATQILQESTSYPPDSFLEEKKKARKFLSTTVDGMTVMDRHQKFLDEYNNMTAHWKWVLHKLKQDSRVMGLSTIGGQTQNRDALIDEIVLTNDAAQQAMNTAWKNLVVNGMHHEVMSALSVLDVESPGEMLQDAKNRLRNSARSSVSGANTIYPVSFQPEFWSEMLSTAFTPTDLLMEPREALGQMKTLLDRRNSLQDQINTLTMANSADITKLQLDQANKQAEQMRKFQNLVDLLEGDTDLAVLVTLYCSKGACKGKKNDDLNCTAHPDLPFEIPPEPLGKPNLMDVILQAVKAQEALLAAAKEYKNSQSSVALQQLGIFNEEIKRLTGDVHDATKELEELKSAYAAVVNSKGAEGGTFEDKDFWPSMPKAGPWARVMLVGQKSSDAFASASRSMSEAGSAHTAYSSSSASCTYVLWWGGCEAQSQSAYDANSYSAYQASGSFQQMSQSSEFSIAFEAAKVTFDRGGWFKPEFLEHSDLFMKFGDKNISRGRPEDDEWSDPDKMAYYRQALLPTYPVAFILARDITIKITNTRKDTKSDWAADSTFRSSVHAEGAGSGSGMFGFFGIGFTGGGSGQSASASNGFASAGGSQSGRVATKVEKDALIVKVAGAQIIMWVQNYIGADKAKTLKAREGRPGYDVLDTTTAAPRG